MKKLFAAALSALLLFSLSACKQQKQEVPADPSDPGLLLVESKPQPAETQPETRPAPTLPDFIQDSIRETAAPTEAETKPAPTVPTEKPEQTGSKQEGKQPVITKHPTREEVNPGGEARFVAHAEKAQGVLWQFLSPEDKQPQTMEMVAALYPELKIEGTDKDTLILGNIPLAFSGWSVRAEFYNDSGSQLSEPAFIRVTDAPTGSLTVAYDPVIGNCKYIQRFDPSLGIGEKPGPEDIYSLYDGRALLGGGLGYAMMDLDGNGVQELVVGCPGTNSFGPRGGDMIFALFTLRGDSPVKVLQSWPQNRYYLSQGSRIFCESDRGSDGSVFTVNRLENGQLVSEQSIWTEASGTRYFSAPNGNPAEKQPVSDRGFYELQAKLLSSREPLPPLTDIPGW